MFSVAPSSDTEMSLHEHVGTSSTFQCTAKMTNTQASLLLVCAKTKLHEYIQQHVHYHVSYLHCEFDETASLHVILL